MKIAAFLVAWLAILAHPVRAADTPDGVWVGRYHCGQGETGLTLTIQTQATGGLRALFHFYAVQTNPSVPEGCYTMSGTFDPVGKGIYFIAKDWLLRPDGYVTVDLSGRIAATGDDMRGAVQYPTCGTFALYRVQTDPRPTMQSCRAQSLLSWVAEQPTSLEPRP
jgi:hypothetical protein